jgi:hypothetical protein
MLPFLFVAIKCFISLIAVYVIMMLIAFATNTPSWLMTQWKLSSNEMMDIIMQNVFLIITFYFLVTYTFRISLKYSFKLASIFCIFYIPLSYYFLWWSNGYFVWSLIWGSLTIFFAFPVILILVFDIFNYKKNQSKNLDSKLIRIWVFILSIVTISVFIIRMLYLIG